MEIWTLNIDDIDNYFNFLDIIWHNSFLKYNPYLLEIHSNFCLFQNSAVCGSEGRGVGMEETGSWIEETWLNLNW